MSPELFENIANLPRGLTTRFAPSPTGYLHLGHVASALWVWGVARATQSRVILRLEDHDQGRSRPAYEQAIFDDLHWLGLQADNAAELVRGQPSIYRQRDRHDRYRQIFAELNQKRLIYPCSCTRKQVQHDQPQGSLREELRYMGRCRPPQRPDPSITPVYRLWYNVETYDFFDYHLGWQRQTPALQCGDPIIFDRHQQWTYHYACVIDDWDHDINLVVRGQDLTHCTGRQLQFDRLLGAERTRYFFHHPLIYDQRGQKLSKRDQAASITEQRLKNRPPEEIIGKAAYLTGIVEADSPQTLDAILGIFQP
jgi:glutamyl-tRNA synthetase/glutamyl-Q tRNA(Asp) synthetase